MGPKPFRERVHRAINRLARRRRGVRGIVTPLTFERLTRWELLRLRYLGFVPTIAGGSGAEETGEEGGAPEGADAADDVGGAEVGGEVGRDPDTFPRSYVENLRRESQGYRTRALDAEGRLQQIDEADASELDRQTRRADDADAALAETRTELWRLRAAVRHTIPEDLTDLLVGATEDEVMSQAERLARRLGDQGQTPTPPRVTRRPETPDLRAQIAEAESRGDWALASQLKAQQLAAAKKQQT